MQEDYYGDDPFDELGNYTDDEIDAGIPWMLMDPDYGREDNDDNDEPDGFDDDEPRCYDNDY